MHLAAISNDPLGDLNPECTFDINWRATARLGRVAKAGGRQPLPLLVVLLALRRPR